MTGHKTLLHPNHPDIAISYNNLGNAYLSKGEYNKAIEYYEKALTFWSKNFGANCPSIADSYRNLGVVYFNKKEYKKAIEFIQKSIHLRMEKLKIVDLNEVNSYKKLGLIFRLIENYHSSANSYSEALKSINAYRKDIDLLSSKTLHYKLLSEVYAGGIAVNLILFQQTDSIGYLRESFHYSEQSKSLTLYESLKNAEALHLSGIPDSLLGQELNLRIDIAYNEKRRQSILETGKTETDPSILNINNKLFDLRRRYESLIRTFETEYPKYYHLKYNFLKEDVTTIQKDLLQSDQALLEYFVSDSSIYIFLVKKEDYRVIEVKKDFPLEGWIRQLRHGIYGYFTGSVQTASLYKSTTVEYLEAAQHLYEKLLAPVDSLLPKRVIIVPDRTLGYVPFEALIAEQPEEQWDRFQNHAYFFRYHQVSYCYSATLLREMMHKRHKKEPKGSLVAFAPFYGKSYQQVEDIVGNIQPLIADSVFELIASRKDFKPLPNTGPEVAIISKIWNGRFFLNSDATESQFSEIAEGYLILHLATHGVADYRSGDYSYLPFAQIPDSIENELLYVREIYNLSLNADLVTLSACETGIGEFRQGEGIISLARAFSFAGAKSIITSLWAVDDERTKDLMIAFYQNLKKGMLKDAALSQARRDFLETNKGLDAHPYFWAGFVAIGDMEAIK